MTQLILNIMAEQVGSPPVWSGDISKQEQEIARWQEWSVRKRMYESVLTAHKVETDKVSGRQASPARRSR